MTSKKVMSRAVVALALGTALAMSTAALAGAQGFGSWGHNLASPRVSPFSYANNGTGGDVTAVSMTSITITEWNGTSATFTLTPGTTTYTEGKTSVTWSALATGERVNIGVSSSDPTTATSVNIELAQLIGTVQSTPVGDTILITDPQGFTRTILVGSGTTYQGGTFASITTGTKIFAQGTVDTNGTTLDAVNIYIGTSGQMTMTWGVVTAAVTGTSITVESKGGTSTLFTYTTNTTIKSIGRDSVTLPSSDLAVGEHVAVETNSTAATTAVSIWVQLVHLSGVVTGVSGDTITISDHQGFTRLILTGDMTTYTEGGATFTAGLGGITTGMHIRTEGLVDANGTTLDALSIDICTTNQNQSSAQVKFGVGGGFGGGFG
ncbi:MAG: hypothetical protein WA580_08940, partial [Acidimicrobiales bacterium]